MVIELLKIFVSWPFVILILGLAFGITFRAELAQFIKAVGTIKLPGGAEILTNQTPPPKSETPEKKSPPEPDPKVLTLNEEQQQIIREHIKSLTKQATDAKQEKENILEVATTLLAEKERDARYWWFMYLSFFLVSTTQNVLRWFAAQALPPTKEYYNEVWKTVVQDSKQREIILMVLFHHGLLEIKGHLIQVTQNGRDFINFVGSAVQTQ